MHLFFLVAPYRIIAPPDATGQATTSAIIAIPEAYITGVELILCSAIVLLVLFALQKPQAGREPLDGEAGRRPRR